MGYGILPGKAPDLKDGGMSQAVALPYEQLLLRCINLGNYILNKPFFILYIAPINLFVND